jgi:hypothetical protein
MVLHPPHTPRTQQPRVRDACRLVSASVMLAAPPSRLASTIFVAPVPPLPLTQLTLMPRTPPISLPPAKMHAWNLTRTSSHNNTVESRATMGHPSRSPVPWPPRRTVAPTVAPPHRFSARTTRRDRVAGTRLMRRRGAPCRRPPRPTLDASR